MNRKEIAELMPIIQAFLEGRTIECRTKSWEFNKGWRYETDWKETQQLVFRDTFEYRIKPEFKYRPFKDAEECWNEMEKHRHFGWIRCKDTSIPGKFMLINSLRNDEASIISGIDFTYSELLECYTFVDGAPFGVKEEE